MAAPPAPPGHARAAGESRPNAAVVYGTTVVQYCTRRRSALPCTDDARARVLVAVRARPPAVRDNARRGSVIQWLIPGPAPVGSSGVESGEEWSEEGRGGEGGRGGAVCVRESMTNVGVQGEI